MPTNSENAHEIRRLRLLAELSQEEAGRLVKVSKDTISRWERGRIPVKDVYVEAFRKGVNNLELVVATKAASRKRRYIRRKR